MNIYKLDYKKIRVLMTKFMKTIYGKITFILAYSIPIILSSILLVVVLSLHQFYNIVFITLLIYILLFLILVSFVLGTIYYYHELKEFIKEQD